jgi:hypothetical protein
MILIDLIDSFPPALCFASLVTSLCFPSLVPTLSCPSPVSSIYSNISSFVPDLSFHSLIPSTVLPFILLSLLQYFHSFLSLPCTFPLLFLIFHFLLLSLPLSFFSFFLHGLFLPSLVTAPSFPSLVRAFSLPSFHINLETACRAIGYCNLTAVPAGSIQMQTAAVQDSCRE